MIGQKQLIDEIKSLMDANKYPHFSIIVGDSGSGKKTLLKEVFSGVYPEDNSVDSIRKIVELSYKLHNMKFLIPDAETLSVTAQNALLKVVEECPNGNYYVLTVSDINNVLYTIKSRAQIFKMLPYTPKEIFKYCCEINVATDDVKYARQYCVVPGDVNKLIAVGASNFIDFVNLVMDNIAEVSGANAFKIADKIALKDEMDKFDLKLFWTIFVSQCLARFQESDDPKYLRAMKVTSQYISDMRIRAINKQMLFDMWILAIREEWC